MNIQELNKFFAENEGTYGAKMDYTSAEYELCRYFITQSQPKTISIIGGNTNLDLFYSCQGVGPDIKVTNWDMGMGKDWDRGTMKKDTWKAKHEQYQKLTGFTGKYEWILKGIQHYSEIGDTPDLLWISADQEALTGEIEDWPSHIIFSHYGNMIKASSMVRINKHRPLRAMGRTLAIFSEEDIDLTKGKGYNIKKTDFVGIECMEIFRC